MLSDLVFDSEKMSLRFWLNEHDLLEEYQSLSSVDDKARALRSYGIPEETIQKELFSQPDDFEVIDIDSVRQTLRERPEMKMLFEAGRKVTPEAVLKTAQLLEEFAKGEKAPD